MSELSPSRFAITSGLSKLDIELRTTMGCVGRVRKVQLRLLRRIQLKIVRMEDYQLGARYNKFLSQ